MGVIGKARFLDTTTLPYVEMPSSLLDPLLIISAPNDVQPLAR
jgi:hypothetical protein